MRFVIGLLFACSCVRYTQANHHPFTPPWTEWEGSQVKGVRMFDKDIYKSGHYFFYGCTQEQAESLQGTFKTLGHVISSQVIPEFSRGKPSRYGFSTWFGRNGPGEVLEVYSRIRDGYAEPAQSSNDMNPRQWRPEFVCYDRNMPDYPQAFLESIGTHCSSSTHTSFTLPLTSIVWLCPRLFARPALPDFKPVGRCQLLNGRGTRFAGTTPQIFYNSKAMTLVETMASKYKKVLNTKPPRSRDMNFLANLPDEQKLNAAVNYALYAQCVAAKCTRFPAPDDGLPKSRRQALTLPDEGLGGEVPGHHNITLDDAGQGPGLGMTNDTAEIQRFSRRLQEFGQLLQQTSNDTLVATEVTADA